MALAAGRDKHSPYSSDGGLLLCPARAGRRFVCLSIVAAAAAEWACVVFFWNRVYVYPVLRGEESFASNRIASITLRHSIMVVVQYLSMELYLHNELSFCAMKKVPFTSSSLHRCFLLMIDWYLPFN